MICQTQIQELLHDLCLSSSYDFPFYEIVKNLHEIALNAKVKSNTSADQNYAALLNI